MKHCTVVKGLLPDHTVNGKYVGTSVTGGPITPFAARALALAGGLAADDVTGIGVADDVIIPFLLGAAAISVLADNPKDAILAYSFITTGSVYLGVIAIDYFGKANGKG